MYYDIVESGKRIQELRTAHGMKQVQLAERLNISLDHLRKIEGGQRGCSVDLLINISVCFAVTLDFLILGKERSNEAAQNTIQSLIEQMEALKSSFNGFHFEEIGKDALKGSLLGVKMPCQSLWKKEKMR